MEKIEIKQIPFDLPFEGYYWYSDESKPEILDNKPILESIFKSFPFIVEGNFYNKDEEISISVKNIDGQYLITRANLKGLDKSNLSEQIYLGHDLKGIKNIKLAHYWQESEADDLLAGMTTLIPVWMAFTGFVKQ